MPQGTRKPNLTAEALADGVSGQRVAVLAAMIYFALRALALLTTIRRWRMVYRSARVLQGTSKI
jgi:hypothetical protein